MVVTNHIGLYRTMVGEILLVVLRRIMEHHCITIEKSRVTPETTRLSNKSNADDYVVIYYAR